MRLILIGSLLAVCGGGCVQPPSRPPRAEARLEQLAAEFVSTHFAVRPLEGVALGWHQYDGQFVVPDRAMLDAELARLKRFDAAFAALNPPTQSPARRHDLHLLRATVARQRWGWETQQPFRRNPMFYAGALDVSIYLKREFAPLPDRVTSMTRVLRHAPALFAAARANLDPVLPRPFIETAIDVAEGTAAFVEKDIVQSAVTVTNTAVRAELEAASQAAVAELRGYVDWLKTEKLPRADQSFALGRDAYLALLRAELIDLTPEQILAIGRRELEAEQARMAAAAREIDPTQPPAEVYRAIQREHPTAASLLPDTRKNLEAIRQFLVDRHILTIPSEVRPRVAETLPPFRATSFASMDTPGPFETKATEAYYYVTPVEPHWTPQQAEEWLTAFNYYTTDIVSTHEVYPGHYVQYLALNASPASTVAKVFSSYAFIEGWAHYAEQMMIEAGFAQPANRAAATRDKRVRAAKFRLAQSDEALLRLCRLCCSIQLHTQGMTVDAATRFFVDNCHYEEKPARQEAVRGTYDPEYLYYTLGKLMIYKLRRDWEAQEGGCFTLQRFHDELLRHGAPPIRLLREIMLRDPAQWPAVL